MRILVTGAKGFIGKNLCFQLQEQGYTDIIKIDRGHSLQELDYALETADFIYHLAGVNRQKNDDEFKQGNADLTSHIVAKLNELNKATPILLTSSIQAERSNPYGNGNSCKYFSTRYREYCVVVAEKNAREGEM